MNRIFAATLIVVLGFSENVDACYSPPSEQYTPWQELVRRTDNIILAEVESLEVLDGWYVNYRFKTLRTLKGKFVERFELKGIIKMDDEHIESRDNHTSPFFWAFGGRSHNGDDCRIWPSFEQGHMYLIFKDEPYHNLSFEKIESMDDLWLRTVNVFLTGKDPER